MTTHSSYVRGREVIYGIRVKRVMVRKSKILGVYFILNFLFFLLCLCWLYSFLTYSLFCLLGFSFLMLQFLWRTFQFVCALQSNSKPFQMEHFGSTSSSAYGQLFTPRSAVCLLQLITSSLHFSGTQQFKCFLVLHRAILNRLVPKYHLRSTEMQQHLML